MAQYWIPLPGDSVAIAPSLVDYRRGVGTEGQPKPSSGIDAQPGHADGAMIIEGKKGNPTVIPDEMLKKYHFTFLIRHPRSSVPSYYRCTVPPLKELTGWDRFDPQEVGYKELRVLFEYLLNAGHIGPGMAGNGGARNDTPVECSRQHPLESGVDICVIDADDLLDNPYGVIEAYCKSVGQDYSPDMLKWADEESQWIAKEAFEKWKGFHEDALNSTELRPRTQIKTPKLDDELYAEWSAKYGEKAADMMKKTVEDNVSDYEYLRQFALKV